MNYLLEALPALKEKLGLVIIGNNTNLAMKASNIYPLEQVVSESYMALIYSAVNLFVHPAVEDNLPNTVIESLLCGTPVVAFNIGGIPDIINDDKMDLFVKR